MMNRFCTSLSVFVLACHSLAVPAAAADPVESITRQLAAQGFGEIKVTRTFLGRVRVEALREGREREIIFNPRTGEILRDYWNAETDGAGGWLLGGGTGDEDRDDDRDARREGEDVEDHDDDDHDDEDVDGDDIDDAEDDDDDDDENDGDDDDGDDDDGDDGDDDDGGDDDDD